MTIDRGQNEGTGRRCATMELHRALAQDSGYRERRREIEASTRMARMAPRSEVLRIPVVVHVLHHTDAQNIPDAQIHSQIDALNRDFRLRNSDAANVPAPFRSVVADAKIEFALAVRDPQGNATDGITRTRTSLAVFESTAQDEQRKIQELDRQIKSAARGGHDAWPATSYLNLWVCELGSRLLGYAQFPGGPLATDGVVVAHTAFGETGTARAPFNKGRTATHEVGHWLNLLHIWGDDGGGCDGSDNVADTPNQAYETTGCPSFPKVSCHNGPYGDMFMNYMDYTNDACMFMFTAGQVQRMDAALAGPRASLFSSLGLVAPAAAKLDRFATRGMLAEFAIDEPRLVFDGVDWVERLA